MNPTVEIRGVCQVGGACVVTARAVADDGRTADAIGVASVAALAGDALAANIERAEQAARTRAVMLLTGPAPVVTAGAEPAPAAPAKPVPAPTGEPEMVVPGDPTTDAKELQLLAARKGLDFVGCLKWVNAEFKSEYSFTRTPWLKVNRHHRAACVLMLRELADNVHVPTAGEVWRTFEAIAKFSKLEPLEECLRYCRAVKYAGTLDDMTDAQLSDAYKSARAKLLALETKANGGKVS